MDRQKYSSTFENERAVQNQPRERIGMGNLDPYARAHYKMDSDLSTSQTAGISINRTDVHSVKSTDGKLTDSSRVTTGKLNESRHTDHPLTTALQNPYSHRAEGFPSRGRDPLSAGPQLTTGSGIDKRYPTTAGLENPQMNRDRNSLYINRQTPGASYSSPRENYPPTVGSQYSSRERNPPSVEAPGTVQNRVGATTKKFSSPAEENLRKTLYDKRYQMEAEMAIQRKQAQVLGDYKSQLSQREKEDLERVSDRRLDSGRGRYDTSNIDRTDATDRRLRDAENMRLSSAAVSVSSKLDPPRDTDLGSARKPFIHAELGKEAGIDRSRWHSEVTEKPVPRVTAKPKDEYYRDDQKDRESGKRVQNITVKGTLAHDRSQQQRDRLAEVDKRLTNMEGSSSRKAADNHQMGRQELSSSHLLKMKEDLLQDQAKLDRQLRTNAVAHDERMPRSDNSLHYDRERSSNLYDSGRSESRSPYATEDRLVCS